jgi:HKD family nuclease
MAWTDLATLAANANSYSNTSLTAATDYTYRVSAVAPGGALVSAGDVSATTFAVTAVPTGVTATAFSSTQINLKWTDAATNETGYRIERRPTSGTTWTVLATLAANSNSYSNTGLTPSTGYTYRVSAIAPGGAAMSAATVAATTLGPTSVPTGVTATAFSLTQINLSWTDVATNETGYRIERRLTSGTAWTVVATLAANSNSYSDTGLMAATGYTYRVSAIIQGGQSLSADLVSALTHGLRGLGLRSSSLGATSFSIEEYSHVQNRWILIPVDLSLPDSIYFIVYCIGCEDRTGISGITAKIGQQLLPVLFYGKSPGYSYLHQLNLGPIPKSLAGSGEVNLVVTFEGNRINPVMSLPIHIK